MISVIIPVFNEEESVSLLLVRVRAILPRLSSRYEVLLVDDGSNDKSLNILKKEAVKDKHLRIFSFRRNLGKAEALSFGFRKAKGDLIVTMDSDLQDKPEEIHKLIAKHKEGLDVVSGWRLSRQDKTHMKLISRFFNFLMEKIFDLGIHDYNSGLKLYTREAAKNMRLYGGLHRFIPLIAYNQGFSVGEVAVEHDPRQFGKSKYGFSKLWKDLPDMFTILFLAKYSKRPLHFFGSVGGVMAFLGFVIITYLSIIHFFGISIGRRPLLLFGILLVIAGLQILFTGFLADLIINIAHTKEEDDKYSRIPLKYSTD